MKDTWLDVAYYFSQFIAIFFMLWIALENTKPSYRALMLTCALMAYSSLLKHEIKR